MILGGRDTVSLAARQYVLSQRSAALWYVPSLWCTTAGKESFDAQEIGCPCLIPSQHLAPTKSILKRIGGVLDE